MYPDTYIWSDPKNLLLAEIATSVSRIKFLTAIQLFQEVPDEFGHVTYGPKVVEDVEPDEHEVEGTRRAREVAAEMLAA
ncbi:hypothetical protein [Gordonia tangerina]|uniref:Uncharacterized protein n=1 Tax=Gordonia tangerina TaxID=2911060 RepID=A0ABS9DRQ9_9ACTN|nr:hypothetical protein [Gordonia tangerina]MCF3941319.1 hypothetical protein [Gordonia tangerina]